MFYTGDDYCMSRTTHHLYSTPDPIRTCHKLERKARPAGRMLDIVQAELAAMFEGAEPFDMCYIPQEEEPDNMNPWDMTDFCAVCGRCTDHVSEHDDLVEAGFAYYYHGNVCMTAEGYDYFASLNR